jgi:Carboxypeptidase regulatory-like domain
MTRNQIGLLAVAIAAAAVVVLILEDRPSSPDAITGGAAAVGLQEGGEAPPSAPSSRAAPPPIRPTSLVAGTGSVAGTVVDDANAPIPGATVEVAGASELRTDSLGGFLATHLEGPTCDLFVEAPGFAWRALRAVRVEPGRVVETRIALEPRPDWLGRAVDDADQPVGGADVVVRFGRLGGFGQNVTAREVLRTSDERGWFSFPGGEPGVTLLSVGARKEGVGTGTNRNLTFAGPTDVVTVKLRPTRKLALKFVPQDGSPPPADLGFTVTGDQFFFTGKADGDGRGVVPGFPTIARGTVHATAAGWHDDPGPQKGPGRTFEVPANGDVDATIPIRRIEPSPAPGIVEGRVIDTGGAPIPGATVNTRISLEKGLEATTDADGRFRVSGVQPMRSCRVGAQRGRGPMTWSEPFELGAGATVRGVTIVVGAAPDLVVEVISADGRRAPGVVVVVEDQTSPDAQPERVTEVTKADGRAEFAQVPSERVKVSVDPASLPPGVGVDQDEDATVSFYLERRQAPLALRLRREVVLRGRLVLEDGTPAGAGTIAYRTTDPSGAAGSVLSLSGRTPLLTPPPPPPPPSGLIRRSDRYVRSDDQGSFSFRACSLSPCWVVDLTRLVRPPGADPVREVFVPVAPATLSPDRENVIVVRRKHGP